MACFIFSTENVVRIESQIKYIFVYLNNYRTWYLHNWLMAVHMRYHMTFCNFIYFGLDKQDVAAEVLEKSKRTACR